MTGLLSSKRKGGERKLFSLGSPIKIKTKIGGKSYEKNNSCIIDDYYDIFHNINAGISCT